MKLPFPSTAALLLSLFAIGAGATSTKGDYEYIVVGAGAAGSIVAGELARHGKHVLLLEAGGDNNDPAIDDMKSYFKAAYNGDKYGFMNWGFETTLQTMAGSNGDAPSKVISLPQGKVLGGSHSINAAAYVQPTAEEYDVVAKLLDDNDWSWKETQCIRRGLEDTLGLVELGPEQTGAEDFIDNAAETLGYPYNPNPGQGEQYGICPTFWTGVQAEGGGRRTSSYDAFVLPFMGDAYHSSSGEGTIDVMTYQMAEELIFDESDDTRVTGIRCQNTRSMTSYEFFATKEVIISAGTYNSPGILMRSGLGPQEHLEEMGVDVRMDLPGVGSNLRDHYGVATFWTLASLEKTSPYLFQSPSLNIFGPEKVGPTRYQMEMAGNFGSCSPLRQTSTGTVRMKSSNAFDAPIIDPNVLGTTYDIDDMVNCLETLLIPFWKGLIAKGLVTRGNLDPDATTEELRDFVMANVGTNHHPVGTCKVGTDDDKMAVVDNNLMVRGMSNLRVIDASVWPVAPSGNINAPVMTVAMLGAKKILPVEHYRETPQTLVADDRRNPQFTSSQCLQSEHTSREA